MSDDEVKRTEREAIHDAVIAPLVSQIIDICEEHKIAAIMCFDLSGPGHEGLTCSTAMFDEKGGPLPFQVAAKIIVDGLPKPIRISAPKGRTS